VRIIIIIIYTGKEKMNLSASKKPRIRLVRGSREEYGFPVWEAGTEGMIVRSVSPRRAYNLFKSVARRKYANVQ
jgi:hypothetical protein